MNPNLSDWDDDLPPEPEEAYQDLLRALKRKSGFGLFFVQCTPVEADKFIVKLPQEIPQKKIAVLRLVESIDNLYQPVAEFVKDKQIDILLIKGLEYSLYKYEKRSFGEITEGQFSNLTSVPHILNHLNQQRERFRDDFPVSFVFLLRSFSINYFIHRAPDFFDWRSGVFELPTTLEVVEQESNRLLLEGDYEEYLKLSPEQKIEKVLEIQELLTEKHQPDNRRASLLFELGNLLFAAKEYEQAITSYDQALKIQPDHYKTWIYRGAVLCDYLQRYEEAIASFDQALKFKPDDDKAWYNRSIALENSGRYEEALASYDQALQIKPDEGKVWDSRGSVLWTLGRYEEALASCDQALQIKPDDHTIWHNRGIALKDLGRNEEAIASFDQALEFQPNDYHAWSNRGIALRNLGRYEEAIASDDQALKINSNYCEAWNNRGVVLCDNLQRYEEAIISFDEVLKIQADDYVAWSNRGIALRNLGRYEEAIASYDQALKFKPDKHEAWYNLGYALDKLGRNKEAIASYDQALKFKPDYHQAWNNRGNALMNLERYEEAITSYEQALKFKPDKHEAWYNRGIILTKLGRRKEGFDSINKATEINPKFVIDMSKSQNKQVIDSMLQKFGWEKLTQAWIGLLKVIGIRR
ncbi:tetratricopeptide repeat protein [Nostoc sp.]|uniref:tetratricopeptide repeat protein n=1 Tax=Nostoc sp. TaxID=1180 RepID=UPI002FFC4185